MNEVRRIPERVCAMITQQLPEESGGSESGFGLIEIVISMFLLGLLAIAFLPLLVTSIKTTGVNATAATATQLVNQQMELARGAGDTCTALTAYNNETLPVITDSRGFSYQPTRAGEDCTALVNYPATVWVTVSAVPSVGATVSATTLIYLSGP
ncbi:type II secretion system protein [Cryobacterium sp. TMT2-14]|uniref:type II secretion system protein n=1 Tax=Cryobacterium sp. TMT2-14 TaxID=1259245 RepID=UPI00106C1B67|nr:type II secretion system protein [Cryobacterium sp. TMT2-14]TFC37540.1 type II secretion system protein [Cryobacterium sp. TMT2-14]